MLETTMMTTDYGGLNSQSVACADISGLGGFFLLLRGAFRGRMLGSAHG